MKTAQGCKLFGAHQALTGIRDCVTLLHTVVGCNYGSMSLHLSACDMTDIRQSCTVISDSDVVFGGEQSLMKALGHAKELYNPAAIFVITGCVSDIIQDDVNTVTQAFQGKTGLTVIPVEAAGYRGDFTAGFENTLAALADIMAEPKRSAKPSVNILGLCADDYRLKYDLNALEGLFGDKVGICAAFASCTMEDVIRATSAGLNLVFGGGLELAQAMEKQFGTPYARLDYPYGLTGAKKLWDCLSERFGLDFAAEEKSFIEETAKGASSVYSHVQSLYGIPASIIGTGARARGMADFLSRELGLIIECADTREGTCDIEDFYDAVCASDTAIVFGSSFEQELADKLEIPLVRFEYPVFDRIALTPRPYIGPDGTLCLLEDILNEIMHARRQRGALYH